MFFFFCIDHINVTAKFIGKKKKVARRNQNNFTWILFNWLSAFCLFKQCARDTSKIRVVKIHWLLSNDPYGMRISMTCVFACFFLCFLCTVNIAWAAVVGVSLLFSVATGNDRITVTLHMTPKHDSDDNSFRICLGFSFLFFFRKRKIIVIVITKFYTFNWHFKFKCWNSHHNWQIWWINNVILPCNIAYQIQNEMRMQILNENLLPNRLNNNVHWSDDDDDDDDSNTGDKSMVKASVASKPNQTKSNETKTRNQFDCRKNRKTINPINFTRAQMQRKRIRCDRFWNLNSTMNDKKQRICHFYVIAMKNTPRFFFGYILFVFLQRKWKRNFKPEYRM